MVFNESLEKCLKKGFDARENGYYVNSSLISKIANRKNSHFSKNYI